MKDQFQCPAWQTPYREVLTERDPQKLPDKLAAAEGVIVSRFQQLAHESNGLQERLVMRDAIYILRSIQRERLGYPAWENERKDRES
jgi:hypothetical protein